MESINMAEQEFKHLFSPIKIGNITLHNRLVCPAHCTAYFGEGEAPNERMAHYLAARARGGVGMIVTPQNVVWPSSTSRSYIATCDDKAIPKYEMISRVVHDNGAKVVAQLTHLGSLTGFIDDAGAGFAASVSGGVMGLLPNALGTSVTHEISIDEIKLIIKSYADSARRMQETGYDGVEITSDVGTGGLLVSFMSPMTNRRTDEYGGSLDNRFRFQMEIIDAVRKAVGPDFVVGLRLVGDMLMNGGTTLEDTKIIAAKVEAEGKVDYLSISAGMLGHIPPMYFPLGCFVYLAAGVKEAVSLPVICHGRINDPVQAEQILADNQADLIGVARALISDPEWPNKAREGRTDEIRKCIACIQSCAGNFLRRAPVTCAINPEAGREETMATIVPATVKKKIMVIGGGAAGLEVARVATLRGHSVTLYEKEKELGGQLNVAARIPKREDFAEVPRYYNYQMQLLGVKVMRETEVTPETVRQENPDVVVVAAGSVPTRPMAKGGDSDNVVWVRDVLQEKVEVGNNVLVIAAEQHEQALGVAIFLAEKGKKVELITHCLYAGSELETNTLTFMYPQFLNSGGVITPLTQVKEISGNTVVVGHTITGAERRIEGIDTVVYSAIGKANDALYHALKGEVKEIYAIGHCLAPRLLQDSVWDAAVLARSL
jgi:2,4-dienoyl-CoA reductase-like NADH-dependent reductase (Old Yellow Enzyme family)/thioredoxin reductase